MSNRCHQNRSVVAVFSIFHTKFMIILSLLMWCQHLTSFGIKFQQSRSLISHQLRISPCTYSLPTRAQSYVPPFTTVVSAPQVYVRDISPTMWFLRRSSCRLYGQQQHGDEQVSIAGNPTNQYSEANSSKFNRFVGPAKKWLQSTFSFVSESSTSSPYLANAEERYPANASAIIHRRLPTGVPNIPTKLQTNTPTVVKLSMELKSEDKSSSVLPSVPSPLALEKEDSKRNNKKRKPRAISTTEIQTCKLLVKALTWYKDHYGDLIVPRQYEIPVMWKKKKVDPEIAGLKLGEYVCDMRTCAQHMRSPYDKPFIELGLFPPTSQFEQNYSAKDIEQVLKIHLSIYGHLDIPLAHRVNIMTYKKHSKGRESLCDDFPLTMDGAPLGEILADIKNRCLYFNPDDMKNRWRPLNISFTPYDRYELKKIKAIEAAESTSKELLSQNSTVNHIDMIIDALFYFNQTYGYSKVPTKYVINCDETSSFPRYLHGFELGAAIFGLRKCASYNYPPYQDKLVAYSIFPPPNKELENTYSATDIEHALQTYKTIHGNLREMPLDFTIPDEEDSPYPLQMLGAPLGRLLDEIRKRTLYFNAADQKSRWSKLAVWLDKS